MMRRQGLARMAPAGLEGAVISAHQGDEKAMADRHMPWSVKGVSPQARRTAKQAALQAGQPIGAWLSAAIDAWAAQSGAADKPTPPAADDGAALEARLRALETDGQATRRLVHQVIESLTRRIAALEATQPQDPTG